MTLRKKKKFSGKKKNQPKKKFSNNESKEQESFVLFAEDDEVDVTEDSLTRYLDYLKTNITFPCQLTGIEDMGAFGWEEYYSIGHGSKEEWKELKKENPSYTDTYELIQFLDLDETDEDIGILVEVRRISDEKIFILPLADLDVIPKRLKNFRVIKEYVIWFVNNR